MCRVWRGAAGCGKDKGCGLPHAFEYTAVELHTKFSAGAVLPGPHAPRVCLLASSRRPHWL